MRRNSTVAGAHARSQVTTSLINRPNLLRIAHDTHLLHTRGLIHLINSRSEELRPYTYQPGFQCPPDPAPQSLSTPPYPTDYALTNIFHLLSEGGRILRPEGYVPLFSLGRSSILFFLLHQAPPPCSLLERAFGVGIFERGSRRR